MVQSIRFIGTDYFSLFRANTQEEALARFEAYTHRVPNFVQMVKEMYNVPGLQKVILN